MNKSRAIQYLESNKRYNRHRPENGINLPASADEAARVGLPQHSGSHRNYSAIVSEKLEILNRDFERGMFRNNDKLLLERVQKIENEMRAHVLTIQGRVN